MGVPSAQKQADLLKDRGNLYFKKEKLGAAIEAYTEAITLCPSVPVYWTNRALCERKRNEWEKVEADCRRALELDNHSVKAYYMLGLALLQYQQYEEAVKQLERALDLGRGATGNYMVEEIWQELSKARLAGWEAVSKVREHQQFDLKLHLVQLLREDYERQLNEAIASIKAAVASASTQGPSPVRVENIRLGSSSDQGPSLRTDTPEEKSEINGDVRGRFMPGYPHLVLSNFYRTFSEPTSLPEEFDERNANFDPLKQHKLSLRRGNSLSTRRQKSQIVLGGDEGSSRSLKREGVEQSAEAGPEIRAEEKLEPEIRPPDPEAPSHARAVESTTYAASESSAAESTTSEMQGNYDASNFHSIYDVFKVFKEFMKLHQHEAGQKLLRISELYQRRSKVLEDVFTRVAAPDQPTDVPDHLCCKITMDIFRDPVITSSGITYERAAILDHLHKVGKFDPFTRAPLQEGQIVPNLAIKDAVHEYLDEHGWAYGPDC